MEREDEKKERESKREAGPHLSGERPGMPKGLVAVELCSSVDDISIIQASHGLPDNSMAKPTSPRGCALPHRNCMATR